MQYCVGHTITHSVPAPQASKQEGEVRRECTASLALCMLLRLKQHLKAAYSLTSERISSFNPGWLSLHLLDMQSS